MKSKRIITFLQGCFIALSLCAQVGEVHVRLTNLPHVYINTFSGRAVTSKTTYVLARMWMVDEQDSVAFYDSLEIRGRGNSTWDMAKKPYKLKFHQKEKLLGKGYAKTKKWTLLANHGDKTLLRNALTSSLGQWLGMDFNPAAKFVDLTFNGQYVGTYQISDQIDVRPHRVDITEQDIPLTDQSNITGGYLLEADGFADFQDGRTGFRTTRVNAPIRIHYPDEDDIQPTQYQYIRNYVNTLEGRIFANTYTDPDQGYRPMVDSTSLANWYLATEISGNIDGFYSTYFYKDRDDDRIFWGPLWDYDIAYGNDNRLGDTSRQLMRDIGYGTNILRPWIQRMWTDPWFTNLIARRYHQAIDNGLEAYMQAQIDSLVGLLDQSQQLNYQRWGINQRVLRERVLYSTYDQYVQDLRQYVATHLSYISEVLDQYVPEVPQPKVPDFQSDTLLYYAIANAGTSTVLDLTATDAVCANASDPQSESQQWHIRPLSNGYLHITNRMTGRALNDPTPGEPTPTTALGAQLNTAPADSLDVRQQWDLVRQTNERFNLVNRFSQHAANLSTGNAANGTSVLSYTNDERNASSQNRLWRITATGEVGDGIQDIPESPAHNAQFDYALAYDPDGQRLHFGADHPSALHFAVRLYDRSGRLLLTFRAVDGCLLHTLPRGLYIVSWQTQGRTHSVKFQK